MWKEPSGGGRQMNTVSNEFPRRAHEGFLELCALSTSGELTEGDRQRLDAHLAVCRECCEAKRQFEEEVFEVDPHWSPDRAEAEFFERLALAENVRIDYSLSKHSSSFTRAFHVSGTETWRNVWMLFAAATMLGVALGISAYQTGV